MIGSTSLVSVKLAKCELLRPCRLAGAIGHTGAGLHAIWKSLAWTVLIARRQGRMLTGHTARKERRLFVALWAQGAGREQITSLERQ